MTRKQAIKILIFIEGKTLIVEELLLF